MEMTDALKRLLLFAFPSAVTIAVFIAVAWPCPNRVKSCASSHRFCRHHSWKNLVGKFFGSCLLEYVRHSS